MLFVRYKYVVILDIDEMIVPVSTDNWHDMMAKVRSLKSGKDTGPPIHF